MWSVWKQSWMAGRYRLPDGRTVEYSPADLETGLRNVRGMLGKGLRIPLAWKHVAENVPRGEAQLSIDADMDPGERNLWTFGRVTGARREADGSAWLELTGRRPEDLERLKDVGCVSPQVHPGWTDPDGQQWDGPVITHVAAVGNPIQFRQQPFALSADKTGGPVWLSADAYEGKNMADEPKPDDASTGDQAACPPEIIEALRATGMAIPEEATTVNEVVVAIKASQGTTEPEPETPPGTEAPPPPVTMSADAQALVRKVAVLEGELLRGKRADFEKRAIACCNRGALTPVERDAWIKQVRGAVQLSADGSAKGAIPVQLAADLAAHEKLPDDSIWATNRKTARGGEAPLPADAVTQEQHNEAIRKEASERAKGLSVSGAK